MLHLRASTGWQRERSVLEVVVMEETVAVNVLRPILCRMQNALEQFRIAGHQASQIQTVLITDFAVSMAVLILV